MDFKKSYQKTPFHCVSRACLTDIPLCVSNMLIPQLALKGLCVLFGEEIQTPNFNIYSYNGVIIQSQIFIFCFTE